MPRRRSEQAPNFRELALASSASSRHANGIEKITRALHQGGGGNGGDGNPTCKQDNLRWLAHAKIRSPLLNRDHYVPTHNLIVNATSPVVRRVCSTTTCMHCKKGLMMCGVRYSPLPVFTHTPPPQKPTAGTLNSRTYRHQSNELRRWCPRPIFIYNQPSLPTQLLVSRFCHRTSEDGLRGGVPW